MEINLKFGDDEGVSARIAIDGGRWMLLSLHLDRWLRNKQKYDDAKLVDIQDVRDEIANEMFSNNLSWDE